MGNVDTKLNFRKAIVQLGTKDRVSRSVVFDHKTYFYFFRHGNENAYGAPLSIVCM